MTDPTDKSTAVQLAILTERVAEVVRLQTEFAAVAERDRDRIYLQLAKLREDLTHYKGLIGGVALVFSGIAVLLALAKGWLFGRG